MVFLLALILGTVAVPPAAMPPLTAPANVFAPQSTPQDPCPLASTKTELVQPPAMYAVRGVLDVTLTLSQSVRGNVPALCWVYSMPVNGKLTQLSIPPTFNLRQGERLSITLVNSLKIPSGNLPTPPPISVDGGSPGDTMSMPMGVNGDRFALMCHQPELAPTPSPDPITGRVYGYHRSPWNETNLHFHGLNTSPKAPSDDVVNVLLCPRTKTGPANTYHYVVDIPRDEPPGLYWYHPHPHGESLYEVFKGLTGAIIVHTLQPSTPDKLPNRLAIVRDASAHQGIATAKYASKTATLLPQTNFLDIRRQLALGNVDFKRNPGGDPFQAPDQCPGPKIPFNTTNLTVDQIALPFNGDSIVGLPEAKIGLGETQYWRLANTDAQTTLDLVLLVNGKPAPFMVTARDGVPLILKNGRPTYQPVAMDHVLLAPAARVEFYMTGSLANADMVVRTRAVDTGCVGDTDLARNLFDVKVGTKQVVQHVVIPPNTDPVAQRFSDLALATPVRKRVFVLTEYIRPDEPEPDFYITEISNPKAIEHPYRMEGPPDTVVKDGTVEEWSIINYTNEVHGFHIHQIHFMPTAGVNVSEGLGQMLDTVYISHGGYDKSGKFVPHGVKLLMDFRARDIVGTFVYHCHFLEHEDNGMMARIQVVP